MTDKLKNQLTDLLEQIYEYMENKSDIVDGDNGPIPNTEMRFSGEIDTILGKLKSFDPSNSNHLHIASLQREEDLVTEMIAPDMINKLSRAMDKKQIDERNDFDLEEEKFHKYRMDADIQEREMKEEFNHEFKD